MPEHLAQSAQENLISLLAHNDQYGRLVAYAADPNLFEGEYKTIVERIVDYWRQHQTAPKHHTADLFADLLEDRSNNRGKRIRQIIVNMAQLHEGMNAKYVVRQLQTFTRLQSLKVSILEAADFLQNDRGGNSIERVETLLDNILRARDVSFDTGVKLKDYQRVLEAVDERQLEFDTGIAVLDRRNIIPRRGTMMCLIAPAGTGKTWWLIHLGKRAFIAGRKVLHISLENDENDLLVRYYQALFAATKHNAERQPVTTLEVDDHQQLVGFGRDYVVPDFTFQSRVIGRELKRRVNRDVRMGNVVIKQFPERALTINGIKAFMESLETVDNFIPDLLIVDYPGKMTLDPKNFRLSLGMTYSELRGLCVSKNIAGCVVHQASREGMKSKTTLAVHAGEDISVVQTADVLLTLSATEKERNHGIARLFVSKARSERDKFGLVLTQNYDIGQFCLDAVYLKPSYYQLFDSSFPDSANRPQEDTDAGSSANGNEQAEDD
jgi:hypothetical protein